MTLFFSLYLTVWSTEDPARKEENRNVSCLEYYIFFIIWGAELSFSRICNNVPSVQLFLETVESLWVGSHLFPKAANCVKINGHIILQKKIDTIF